jgi:hypothetical protein
MTGVKYIGYVELDIADILFAIHGGCSFRRWSYAMMTTYSKRGALL